ncbi:hemerythrin domain-containing protein [Vallicoccus soli]|uniref:Hemerythrin domain-containing protein n=2 Tax=Vallicoccus soli TaxID=2339232 RepID=A0A3A3Z3V2_9ACTN|nr:hemerythrin domain-containing protein [Vallicoccus soli]
MLAYDRAGSPDARARVVSDLAERALRHAFAEETVLFPAYRKHLPAEGDRLTAHIEGEHQEINELLQDLQDADPAAPSYDARVRRLFALISDDARNEEDALLPRLQQVASEDELRAIGAAWEAARTASPTRPHPGIPRRPPGNALAGVALAASDRVEDLLEGSSRRQGTGLLGSALAGVVAGAAGVAVMTLGEKVEQALTGRASSEVPGRTLSALLGRRFPEDDERRFLVNHAMHWGQGALLGAVRGLMARSGHRGAGASAVFTVLRLSADQTLENGTGVGAPPWTWPRGEQVVDVLHKVVYAVVTGAVADRLVRPPAPVLRGRPVPPRVVRGRRRGPA